MQTDNVDIVVDSKTTNDTFHFKRPLVLEFGHIISGCQKLIHSQFTNYRVEFNRRQINTIAHTLAREVVLSVSLAIYFHIHVIFMILLLMICYKHLFFKIKKIKNST